MAAAESNVLPLVGLQIYHHHRYERDYGHRRRDIPFSLAATDAVHDRSDGLICGKYPANGAHCTGSCTQPNTHSNSTGYPESGGKLPVGTSICCVSPGNSRSQGDLKQAKRGKHHHRRSRCNCQPIHYCCLRLVTYSSFLHLYRFLVYAFLIAFNAKIWQPS